MKIILKGSRMMENKKISIADIQQLPTDTIGHDLLRYIGLQDLVAQENDSLLYYIGKRFARKFDINSIEDIALIFHMMKWGRSEERRVGKECRSRRSTCDCTKQIYIQ